MSYMFPAKVEHLILGLYFQNFTNRILYRGKRYSCWPPNSNWSIF